MLSIQTSLSWALPVYNNCRRRYLIIACCQTEQRNPQWVLYAGGAGEDLQRCVFFIGTLSHEISWFRSRAISVKPPEHEKRFERGSPLAALSSFLSTTVKIVFDGCALVVGVAGEFRFP